MFVIRVSLFSLLSAFWQTDSIDDAVGESRFLHSAHPFHSIAAKSSASIPDAAQTDAAPFIAAPLGGTPHAAGHSGAFSLSDNASSTDNDGLINNDNFTISIRPQLKSGDFAITELAVDVDDDDEFSPGNVLPPNS